MNENKRFQDIYNNISSEVRDTSSSFQTIAKRYANDGYMEIIRRLIQSDAIEQFRTYSLTTTAGTRSYDAPFDMGEIVYCVDTSNSRDVAIFSEADIYQKYIRAINTTGVPFCVTVKSQSNFLNQPTSSTTVGIFSSSGNDTTQTLFLRGISGSAEFYESVTLNGTTTANSSNSYDYLLEAAKSATSTGRITIVYNTGGSTASIISPESYSERYKSLEFYYVPAGAYTYTIRYRRLIKPMSQDNDFPIVDVAQGIEYFGIARSWEYKRQLMTATHFMNKFEGWYTSYVTDLAKNRVQQFDVIPYSREY